MTAMLAQTAGAEAARVRALEDLGILGTGREERFDRITRLVQRLFGVEKSAIVLLDHNTQWYKSEVGIHAISADREHAFCNHTIARSDPFVVVDAQADPRFTHNPFVTGEPHVRFYAGVALAATGGYAVGTLCVFDSRPRTFTPAEAKILVELAGWVEGEMNSAAEMARAAEVQQALLPDIATIQVPGYSITGTCLPARVVGGDLVDCYRVADDVVVTVGDVMGKGMAAALMMAAVRSALRAAARRHSPGQAIREAELALDAELGATSTLVTLCQAQLTPATAESRGPTRVFARAATPRVVVWAREGPRGRLWSSH